MRISVQKEAYEKEKEIEKRKAELDASDIKNN